MFFEEGNSLTTLGEFSFDCHDMAFRHFALVEVKPLVSGTLVRWDPAHAPQSSVSSVIDHIAAWPAPYHLEFYVHGWLRETYFFATDAVRRIEEASHLGDVYPVSDFFSRPLETPSEATISALRAPAMFDDLLLRSAPVAGLPLASVGSNSLLARTLGAQWLEDGAQEYEARAEQTTISASERAYYAAHASGKPQFDHVIARVLPDDDEPFWLRYERIVWPELHPTDTLVTFCLERRRGATAFTRQFPVS